MKAYTDCGQYLNAEKVWGDFLQTELISKGEKEVILMSMCGGIVMVWVIHTHMHTLLHMHIC